MKRDFLLGGTKLPTGGAVRGAGGAMSPPVFMLKEALVRTHPVDKLLEQHCYKSAAGLLQLAKHLFMKGWLI